MSYGTLISTVTVGAGGAASISFSSIPSTYTDLVIVLSARDTGTNGAAIITFNGDATTTNYNRRYLSGNGSSASSSSANNLIYALIPTSAFTVNTFGNVNFYIPNYSGSTTKSVSIDAVTESNSATSYQDIWAGLWSGTSAISSVSFTKSAGTFDQYSTASLYGILKGSGGASVS